MRVENAIKTAVEYETKVRDVYVDGEKSISDAVGQRIFHVLAGEEQQHLDYLSSKLQEWKQTGKISVQELASAVPSKEKIDEGIRTLKSRMSDRDREDDLRILKKALDMEIETSNFCRSMIRDLEADVQTLFTRFLEIEEGHEALVQAQIDLISGTGFWFDCFEVNLEAG